MKRFVHTIPTVLISSLILFTSCSTRNHSCSAYAQKIESKLKTEKPEKLVKYLSKQIALQNDFTVHIYGQTEKLTSKDDLVYFLPQIIDEVNLPALKAIVLKENIHFSQISLQNNEGFRLIFDIDQSANQSPIIGITVLEMESPISKELADL